MLFLGFSWVTVFSLGEWFILIKISESKAEFQIFGSHKIDLQPACSICNRYKFLWAPANEGAHENFCLLPAMDKGHSYSTDCFHTVIHRFFNVHISQNNDFLKSDCPESYKEVLLNVKLWSYSCILKPKGEHQMRLVAKSGFVNHFGIYSSRLLGPKSLIQCMAKEWDYFVLENVVLHTWSDEWGPQNGTFNPFGPNALQQEMDRPS